MYKLEVIRVTESLSVQYTLFRLEVPTECGDLFCPTHIRLSMGRIAPLQAATLRLIGSTDFNRLISKMPLTAVERETLSILMAEFKMIQIGQMLNVNRSTIPCGQNNIRRKYLQVTNRFYNKIDG